MPKLFPRVLIVNYSAFHQYDGGAITLSNLFADWPIEELAVLHTDPRGSDSRKTVANFRLKRVLAFPGTRLGAEWKSQKDIMFMGGVNKSMGSVDILLTLQRKVFGGFLNLLGVAPVLEKYDMSEALFNFISSFKPDIIYTQLGNIAFGRMVMLLSHRFNVPIVVHIMDDYPSTLYRKGILSLAVRKLMLRQMEEIFNHATVRMGICQAMCDEYYRRYQLPFLPFHNPVDLTIWSNNPLKKDREQKSFKIVYTGRIGTGACSGIEDMFNVVESWGHKGIDVRFDLYVNEKEHAVKRFGYLKKLPGNVNLMQTPNDVSEVSLILANADILFLPIDFDEDSVKYIRFSMPTKVPAYMAAGRPILVYGPGDVAAVKYAKACGWGYVVEERSCSLLEDAILKLCMDRDFTGVISERARKLVFVKHDASKVREEFRSALANAIQE